MRLDNKIMRIGLIMSTSSVHMLHLFLNPRDHVIGVIRLDHLSNVTILGTCLGFAWSSLSTITVSISGGGSPGQSGDQKINLPSSCSLLTLHRPVENNNNFLASQMFCKDQFVQSGPPVFREVKTSANFSIGSPPIIFLLHQR